MIAEHKPDIVGTTAITRRSTGGARAANRQGVAPNAVTLLGGVHATFMYKQVLPEAPGSTPSCVARARRSW